MKTRRGIYQVAILTFFIEAFVLDGWLPAVSVAVALLFVQLGKPRDNVTLAAPILMLAALFLIRHINDRIATTQGAALGTACESYRAQNGSYPSTLKDLVPSYLQSVPSGRFARNGRWRYTPPSEFNPTGEPLLQIASNPFGRFWWDFKARRLYFGGNY
jgi:hypothetical protein